jgi:hypothetical protein
LHQKNKYISKILFIFIISGLFFITTRCTDEPCYENMDTPVVMTFHKNSGLQPIDTILDSLRVIAGNANYGLRYTNVKSINQFLDPDNKSTDFIFYFDTIAQIKYDSLPKVVEVDSIIKDTVLLIQDTLRYDSASMHYIITTREVDTSLLVIDTTEVIEWNVFVDSIFTNEVVDNVSLQYKPVPHLVSHNCGFAMYYENLKVDFYTTNFIDTVIIIQPDITNEAQENIEIHF